MFLLLQLAAVSRVRDENMVEEADRDDSRRNFDRPSKFRASAGEKNFDRLSELPDSLLLHILSFLSAGDAISTSLLSRRWKDLWKWMDSLEFPSQPPKSKRSVKQFISRALSLHEGLKIKRFCARFHYNYNCISHVDSWVHYMIARNVEKLVLDLFCPDSGVQPYVLPRSIYNCRSLRELEVNLCSIRLPTSFCLSSLEKLVVSNTVFNGGTLRDFLCGCPVLEELVLVNCNKDRDLDVFILNRNLKRMRIVEFFDEVEEGTEVKIYAPYLLHLELQSGDPRPYVILDASSIYSAWLDIRRTVSCLSLCTYNQKNYLQILENIMAGLHEVKMLRLSSWCVQAMLIHEDVHKVLPTSFQHLRHLKLEVKLAKYELPCFAYLLWNSPELETLTIQLCRLPIMHKEELETIVRADASVCNWNEENFWYCHQAAFYSLKHNLKRVVIENFKGEENEIRFLVFLLKNSLVLKNMVILVQPESFTGSVDAYLEYCSKVRRASKMYIDNIRRLMVCPRSPYTEILFSGSHSATL